MRKIIAIFCSFLLAFSMMGHTFATSDLVPQKNDDASEVIHAKVDNVVFIGDSYCEGAFMNDIVGSNYDEAWAEVTAKLLSLENYIVSCKGGTGFVHVNEGVRFIDLVNQAKDKAEDPNSIEWVVIAGGYNDHPDSDEDIVNYSAELFARAHENFPNAEILVGFNAWNTTDENAQENLDRVLLTLRQVVESYDGITYIDHLEDVLYEHPEYFTSDHLHPNADGQKALAEHLAAFIQETADAKMAAQQKATEKSTPASADYGFVLWIILGASFLIYIIYGLRRIAIEKNAQS